MADSGKFYSLVLANISLEGVAHWIVKAGPLLGVLLTVLQIVVAGATVWHFISKKIQSKNEKTPSPPDSTGSGI